MAGSKTNRTGRKKIEQVCRFCGKKPEVVLVVQATGKKKFERRCCK
jgi:hypothetical protein